MQNVHENKILSLLCVFYFCKFWALITSPCTFCFAEVARSLALLLALSCRNPLKEHYLRHNPGPYYGPDECIDDHVENKYFDNPKVSEHAQRFFPQLRWPQAPLNLEVV